MRLAIIVPVTVNSFWQFRDAMHLYANKGFDVVIPVNGCNREDYKAFVSNNKVPDGVILSHVGTISNPYTARNQALKIVFDGLDCDCALLTDADCKPSDNFFDIVQKYRTHELLVAGRTKTLIPINGRYATRHFNWLHDAKFECYDGFTPPHFTVGSCMLIGRDVYRSLGNMRDCSVSGGDGEYGERFEKNGGKVTVADDLIVYKTIYGMDFKGICEKQIRRAYGIADQFCMSDTEAIAGLKLTLTKHLEIIERCHNVSDLQQCYAVFVDQLFKVMMFYGHVGRNLDKQVSK